MRAARQLLHHSKDCLVTIFNGEPDAPYNRAQLSYFLAGDVDEGSLGIPMPAERNRITLYNQCRVRRVLVSDQTVIDQQGRVHAYDRLIFATGSTVRVPLIDGLSKEGVCLFRTREDAYRLIEYRQHHRTVFVIGSGPLGIETALAMKTPANQVYLQVRNTLCSRSLDDNAKGVLSDFIRSRGISIIEGAVVESIIGIHQVHGVALNNGDIIDVDAVVICTGISPSTDLAADAGIIVGRGIRVNEFMQTNVPHIYAIGECAEFDGQTFGLLIPCHEQADTCIRHILNRPRAYSANSGDLQLKSDGFSTRIIGDINEPGCKTYIYKNTLKNTYRKLLLKRNTIQGAIVVGDWKEAGRVAGYRISRQRVTSRALKRFVKTGHLWTEVETPISEQPAEYIVCLCKNVTRGEISGAMERGHRTLSAIGKEVEAGVTCGSCQPLLKQMINEPVPHLVMRHYRKIFWASILSVTIIALTMLSPKLPFQRSVQFAFQFEKIWYGSGYKQFTGYLLLGLCALSGALVMRKRWKRLNLGNLDDWRYAHTLLGLIALVALIVHTGFRLGENLNLILMVVFLLATLTGSLVGMFMSRNHHWTDLKLNQHRAWWSRVHYGLLWMLPALLGFHIVSAYYFA